MKNHFSYRPDTIKDVQLLKILQGLPEPGELKIERTPLAPLIPPAREVLSKKTDTIQKESVPPTREQLRYWWWQRENRLLVDSSRYMESYTDLQFSHFHGIERGEIRLPARQIHQAGNDWLTLIIMLVLILVVSVRTSWYKYLGRLFHSVINASTSNRLFQEKNSSVLFGALQLDILFYLVFSVFIFQLIHFFSLDFPYRNFILYAMSLLFVVSYYFLKKMLYKFAGLLIEKPGETEEFLFNMNNFNRITGLVLLPLITLIAFSPFRNIGWLVSAGIFLVVTLYFLLISRGFITLLKKQFSIFYLFLYFCTLEFLPLVLLYKILVV
jgi:hypothetical protein